MWELLYSHGSSGPLPSLPSSHTQTSPCCFSEVRIHQPQYMSCFFTLVRSFSSWMLERCSVSPVISCLCDHLQNVAFFPFFYNLEKDPYVCFLIFFCCYIQWKLNTLQKYLRNWYNLEHENHWNSKQLICTRKIPFLPSFLHPHTDRILCYCCKFNCLKINLIWGENSLKKKS